MGRIDHPSATDAAPRAVDNANGAAELDMPPQAPKFIPTEETPDAAADAADIPGAGRPEDAGRPEGTGRPEVTSRPEDAGMPGDAGKPEDAGKPADAGMPEDAAVPDDAGKPEDVAPEDPMVMGLPMLPIAKFEDFLADQAEEALDEHSDMFDMFF